MLWKISKVGFAKMCFVHSTPLVFLQHYVCVNFVESDRGKGAFNVSKPVDVGRQQ
jgi:hypothetical protein